MNHQEVCFSYAVHQLEVSGTEEDHVRMRAIGYLARLVELFSFMGVKYINLGKERDIEKEGLYGTWENIFGKPFETASFVSEIGFDHSNRSIPPHRKMYERGLFTMCYALYMSNGGRSQFLDKPRKSLVRELRKCLDEDKKHYPLDRDTLAFAYSRSSTNLSEITEGFEICNYPPSVKWEGALSRFGLALTVALEEKAYRKEWVNHRHYVNLLTNILDRLNVG